MPLLKLWKSICGSSDTSSKAKGTTDGTNDPSATSEKPAHRRRGRRHQTGERIQATPTTPTGSLMDMMSRGSHASICRLVKRSGAATVLEIGVGNGERALAITRTLVDANPGRTVRYAAIDMFEMGDGPISLREFNQQLRSQSVQPTLVPMNISSGLARVSSTIGVVDLVFIAEPAEPIDMTTLKTALKRVTTANSSVYHLVDEKWEKVSMDQAVRQAA